MSVTDEDRERARKVILRHGSVPLDWRELRTVIAQALADERERATEVERLAWNPMVGRVLQLHTPGVAFNTCPACSLRKPCPTRAAIAGQP